MLDITTTTYYFFVIACRFVRLKASVGACYLMVACMQSVNQLEIKHLQLGYCNSRAPINSVVVKNIGSIG